MATTVGQHGVAAFTNPSNGDPLDATVVKANDNTIRDAYVAHDSDPGIHFQSSTLATRPAAGTAGRKWITTDTGSVKIWYDNGSTWEEVSYLPVGGSAVVTGDFQVDGDTELRGDVDLGDASGDRVNVYGSVGTNIVPITNATYDLGAPAARWDDGYFSGDVEVGNNIIIGGGTGDISATTFTGSGEYLTDLDPAGFVGGTFGTGNYAFPGNLTVASGTITGQTVLADGGQMRADRITQSGAGGTVSFSTANHVRHTMTGNGTLTLSGGVAGGVYTVEVLQDSTGGRTITWSTSIGTIQWPSGATPTATTTANRKDVYTFFFDGSAYLGAQFGANYASTA